MAYIGNSPANVGNYQIVDDISSSFNGSLTSFALTSGSIAITPAKSAQLLVGVNGVMQEPDDTGTNGFKVSGSNIVFSSPPANGDTFWAIYQGQNVDIGTPSAGTVGTTQLADGSVTAAKIADGTVVAAEIADNAITNAKMADDAIGVAELSATGTASNSVFLRGDNSWATAGSTSASDLTSGTLPIARIANDAIDSQHYAAGSIDNEHLADDAVGVAELSATGTASSSTFLRGDNSWTAIATDANTTTKGLYEMANTIAANYTITTNNNAISAGPITINSSISVTIPSGSTWVIA
jgi:hypothetical protein